MAKYRQIHIEFWQDGFVLDLTPEEKYFYLYLMTNSKTSQCGIYELPYRIMETETGYNRETVEKLIRRFEDYGKVRYDESTKEIMIMNWARYNFIQSAKVIACIKKELENVKKKEFVGLFISNCKQLGYNVAGLSVEIEEKKQVPRQEEAPSSESGTVDAHRFYQENFGAYGSFLAESITKWTEDLNDELVVEAMKIAIKRQKKWNYAEAILEEWHRRNVKTIAEVRALETEFKKERGEHGGDTQFGSNSSQYSKQESITGDQVGWVGKKEL